MRFRATYPTLDLGVGADALRDWARGAEQLGFEEVYIPEHILGINPDERPDWRPLNPLTMQRDKPIYDFRNPWFDPFVAFGFLAAVTDRITLTSGVLIAPQRQTTLIAKQAAIADVLSGGRVKLGVGVGWNDAEYEAVGADYRTRGRRLDEQIDLLRELWSKESVIFVGEFHNVRAAGIFPRPIQASIPITIGGDSEAAMQRAVVRGDEWFVTGDAEILQERIADYWRKVRERGRPRTSTGVVGTVTLGDRDPEDIADSIDRWRSVGATAVNLRTAVFPANSSQLVGLERRTEPKEHLGRLEAALLAWQRRAATQTS